MVIVKAWDYMTWRAKPVILNRTRFLLIRRHHLERKRERDEERDLVCCVEKFTCYAMCI